MTYMSSSRDQLEYNTRVHAYVHVYYTCMPYYSTTRVRVALLHVVLVVHVYSRRYSSRYCTEIYFNSSYGHMAIPVERCYDATAVLQYNIAIPVLEYTCTGIDIAIFTCCNIP